MRIQGFLIRRMGFIILTLLVLGLLIFYTTTFFDPIQRALLFISPQSYNANRAYDRSTLELIARKYHLYDPFFIQYVNWLRVTLTEGTLGYSHLYNQWISVVILSRFPATFELVMYSGPIAIFAGIKLGAYSAMRAHEKREDPIDFIIRAGTAWAYSIPTFFIALLMLSIFYLSLGWVGLGRIGTDAKLFMSRTTTGWNSYTGLYTIDALINGQFWIFVDAVKHLLLPVATLTISILPVIARITRSSMLGELNKPYIMMAKAKGLQKVEVLSHARKNAMISILTVTSTIFASALTGIVVTEYVFGLPGIGALAAQAAKGLDFPLLAALSLFFCLIFVIINLLVDIIYTYIDPRVKL